MDHRKADEYARRIKAKLIAGESLTDRCLLSLADLPPPLTIVALVFILVLAVAVGRWLA